MMKRYKLFLLAATAILVACNSNDTYVPDSDAIEIRGIQAAIGTQGFGLTRAAATIDPLKISLGRNGFQTGDEMVLTTVKRTQQPLETFSYSNLRYQYDGSNWNRTDTDPEKIYWTDGHSDHTFIGYNLPSATYPWEIVTNGTGSDTFAGELGYGQDTLTYANNDDVMAEDLLVLYSDTTKADDGGLTTRVYFNHALSGVRVVVNIKDFAASSSAVDTQVGVSDMVLHAQPTKFKWGADSKNLSVVNLGDAQPTKDLKLWCPVPEGEGTAQSKTFSFYGLTTPQDAVFHEVTANQQPLRFSFKVTYPDPMNPQEQLTKTYSGAFSGQVDFNSGMCTTLHISLNHKDEQVFTDVTYSDWSLVPTPDLGELRKKSTFMDINSTVTIHTDAAATIDDATWLYVSGDQVKDIYGHGGDSADDAYVIKSAAQLLSLRKEVNEGAMNFAKKYIRLDADITMQKSTTATDVAWTGIGKDDHPFQGTFLGGDRFINRLSGSGLFGNLGDSACVEQLQITTVGSIHGGALAVTNAGIIGGCRVVDDITTDGGALVGINSGTVHACYYTGAGNLVGTNTGYTIGCYQANDITSFTNSSLTTFVNNLNSILNEWYKENFFKGTKFNYTFTPGNYPTVIVANR